MQGTVGDVWTDVSERLRGALGERTFETWLGQVRPGGLSASELVIEVPNDFTREWIEGHFLSLIRSSVRDVIGSERAIRLTVPPDGAPGDIETPAPARVEGLNPRYSFDTFVIGSSNRFAHAAALAVAEAPAKAYNPLFIYGGTGLGKTHLLQAIVGYVSRHSPRLSARYLTSETLTNDFINSIREKRVEHFKHRYRHYDVLLVDDIQFLEHKERIQEEFFHTFNALYEAGRQVILSSDRPPRDIATLEERLRSRFEWGLIVDIQPPDLETRIAILRKKVATDRIHVPDTQVLTFIAGRVSTNIRELEGALTRVVAFSSLTVRPMTVELAEDVLKDVFPQGEPPNITIERIQEVVSHRFSISLQELVGQRRSRAVVYPRHIAMYLCRELTDSSLPKIGGHFGGRDHTTVINATSNITKLIREDRGVYNLVQELTARIKQAP
ncbi:MAG: chromosomal replication initiator protein DnaA [Thermoleophilia bacterium]|nr:chromosomal replication initiator protein DnaA [Thermoleophilia bacterium]